jgi:hypothetical protein
MRGLDPRIHLLSKMMDCRVKPGNDNDRDVSIQTRSHLSEAIPSFELFAAMTR